MSDSVREFLLKHPYSEKLGVHPIWWAKKLERSLKCRNFDEKRQECKVCTDYEKQDHKCFEEAE